MVEPPRIFVRSPGGERLVAWEPPTAGTPIAALLESLLTEYPPSQHGPIDLIDESSGKLVGPEASARTVVNRVLAVRTKYVSDALDQLEALRRQEEPAFDYTHEPGSPTIALDLRYPGLARSGFSGRTSVVVRGRHRAMLTLLGDFPKKPPRILWLSPIFHPNLVADEEVWPPRYNWSHAPSVLTLIGALTDTLVGLTVQARARFSIRPRREINPEAADWYRRNRRAVAALAARVRHGLHVPLAGHPLGSTDADWELRGSLTGGDATVFLSRRAAQGIPEFGLRGPGWLIGEQGPRGQATWMYVERIAPRDSHEGPPAPANAVGILRGPGENGISLSHDQRLPLDARLQNGEAVLRLGSNLETLTGFMVEVNNLPPTEQTPRPVRASQRPITVRGLSPEHSEQAPPAPEPETSPDGAQNGGSLHQRALAPSVCAYCGILCVSGEDWGTCADCGFVMHAECLHRLGGCPHADCPRSALGPWSTDTP